MSNPPLLKVESIGKSFMKRVSLFRRERQSAIKSVSFELERGETLALVGEAGSGKSTLAKILTGVVAPSQGQILVEGEAIAPEDFHRITSYNVCYTKLLRGWAAGSPSGWMSVLSVPPMTTCPTWLTPAIFARICVITSYSIHYTKLYETSAIALRRVSDMVTVVGF